MPTTDFSHADLDWDDQGQPLSRTYGDVYFSRASGLAETRHVFLEQNELATRFAAMSAGEHFVIGETGFGTGLNFLCAWQLFAQQAPASCRLHYVSVERFPLSADDLRRALTLWPELAPFAEALLAQYIAIHPGFQRLSLADGRVTLTLLVGDVLERLPELDARVDAWFLDGFSPAKNPEMWSDALFAQLARLSAPAASLATFTCAGFVRRGLMAAGFDMRKVPGHGHKREMLSGRLRDTQPVAVKPWYARPPAPRGERHALVIGAGLAGCASAASLARRGWRVTVLERHGDVAQEASGNPQGVLYLKLSAHGTPLSHLATDAFGYVRRQLPSLVDAQDWSDCGVLQLAFNAAEAKRQLPLAAAFPPDLLRAVDTVEAQRLAGVSLPAGGLFYPEAGWVHPPALCRAWLDHPAIELIAHQEALELRREAGRWQAMANDRLIASAPVVVVANAAEIVRFAPSRTLPVKRIRGQITRLPATLLSQALTTVVCAEGYVAPARQAEHTLGASFAFDAEDLTPSASENLGNLALLQEISADLAERLQADALPLDQLHGRAAYRCTTPDYLPLVGPLADATQFAARYAVLGKDARKVPKTAAPWLEGFYVNAAHGSRGLVTSALSGELLAAWLNDEPLPVPRAVAEACHPNRFLLRAVVRGQ